MGPLHSVSILSPSFSSCFCDILCLILYQLYDQVYNKEPQPRGCDPRHPQYNWPYGGQVPTMTINQHMVLPPPPPLMHPMYQAQMMASQPPVVAPMYAGYTPYSYPVQVGNYPGGNGYGYGSGWR